MLKKRKLLTLCLSLAILTWPAFPSEKKGDIASANITTLEPAVLWVNPTDITTRNLFYGPGGKEQGIVRDMSELLPPG